VKELKEKNKDIENSIPVMSDLFEDVKNNCSSVVSQHSVIPGWHNKC
jgi:hypothetical protein